MFLHEQIIKVDLSTKMHVWVDIDNSAWRTSFQLIEKQMNEENGTEVVHLECVLKIIDGFEIRSHIPCIVDQNINSLFSVFYLLSKLFDRLKGRKIQTFCLYIFTLRGSTDVDRSFATFFNVTASQNDTSSSANKVSCCFNSDSCVGSSNNNCLT